MEIKLVFYFLETLELLRDLSLAEWNLKNLVCDKLVHLLIQQRSYWKQGGKIRWIRGDAGTRFFHTHATLRHRRNSIAFAYNDQQLKFTNQEAKATLIWESFKQRLGTLEFEQMVFNLDTLLESHSDLASLEAQFTEEEIENTIKALP